MLFTILSMATLQTDEATKAMTEEDKQIQNLIDRAAEAQEKYWDLLREIEGTLDIEIDDTPEFSGLTPDDLREMYD